MANKIKFEDITPCPWNTRGKITKESVKGLAESIKNTVLLEPIVLWKRPDANGYYCVAGCRRLAALKLIGKGITPSQYTIIKGGEDEAHIATLNENFQREKNDPILEAQEVGRMLNKGKTLKEIAAVLGCTENWVSRRAKISVLDPELIKIVKEYPSRFSVIALEIVCEMSVKAQADVLKDIKSRMANDPTFTFEPNLAREWLRRTSTDLDSEAFPKHKCAACKNCLKRTGCQADLFGVADGKLGECLDKVCFTKCKQAFENELIREAVGDAEVVRCAFVWQLPDNTESRMKRDKSHPCAFVFVNGDKVDVRWCASVKEREEREAAEEAENEQKRREDAERRNRVSAICDKLRDFYDLENNQPLQRKIGELLRNFTKLDEDVRDFLQNAVWESFSEYRANWQWANMMRTFDWVAELAGVSEEDAEFVMDEFPEGEDKESL